ncbi:MAG: glycosyltransferase [Bacteroidales bacterium]|nr:glycosyltransferase [Bacteroidales bacterium]
MENKPKILFVANNIPRPDKNSGERRLVSILEMLVEFWDIDFCIAETIYEINWTFTDEMAPYFKLLEEKGIRVLPFSENTFRNSINDNKYQGAYFNLYWVAKELMPLFRKAQPGAFTIVDSVDVHYAREESQARLGQIEQSQVLITKKNELEVYKSADATIAVSKEDLHLLSNVDRVGNVFLIPNIVPVAPRKPGKRDPVVIFIGCYAWYPNPDAVKWFASEIWPTVHRACPKARFLIIGSEPTEEVLALGNIPGIEVTGFVPETRPYLDMAAVSVAPLRFGGGMKGKVNEAMAHGIPVVSTMIGAQGFEAEHGKQIMITDDPGEFASLIITLLNDDALQREMGLAGQQLNSAICSYEAVKEKIRDLVDYFAENRPKSVFQIFRNKFIQRCKSFFLFKNDQEKNNSPVILPQKEVTVHNNVVKNTALLEFPKFDTNPMVSIIIPVHNQWEYTYGCLSSILKTTEGILYEIILIDDCSDDDTRFSDQYVRNIHTIRNESNLGFLFNCNKAAKAAKGKYLIFLNNDTLVQPEWLYWLMRTMEEAPGVGMAGSKLIFSNGKLQEAGGVVFRDASAMNYGREDDPDLPQYNYFKDVDYCSGASICVRKDLWDKLGGFDPQYAPAYYEDTDLAMQIRLQGFRTVYQPKSRVVHFEGISHGTDITQGVKKKQDDNQKVFYLKWKEELSKNHYDRDENLFRARDRSKDKLTALMIGHSVPDRFGIAGKEEPAAIIREFLEKGYMVKYLPDNFQQTEPAVSGMEQLGIEVLYGAWYQENWRTWFAENYKNVDEIYFANKSLADKYLPEMTSLTETEIQYKILA